MIDIPQVAIGAIGAAVIAALISLVGLIISKEQKTSEFRQAWIDALREDLTTYLTQVRGICDGARVGYPTLEKKVETLTPLYAALNKATYAITLRINPDEPDAQSVLKSMSGLQVVISSPTSLTPGNIDPLEAELLLSAKRLLKLEWRRVKRGEPSFVAAKICALIFVIATLAGGGWIVLKSQDAPHLSPAATAKTSAQTVTGAATAPVSRRPPDTPVAPTAVKDDRPHPPGSQNPPP